MIFFALDLTEHVTLVPTFSVPDDLYNRVRIHFSEKDYVNLVILIIKLLVGIDSPFSSKIRNFYPYLSINL